MTFSQRAVEAAARAMMQHPDMMTWSIAIELSEAALTAALAVDGVALQGWQPISSAPAGIDIIGYWQNGEMHTGSTNGDEWFPMFGSDDASWSMPTHWQPLPQPPAASDGEERR